MAVMKQGILGGLSGKIGSVIGSSWKGIAVLKSRPLSVANPQTAGQVAQRSKFSNTIAFASLILATVIKPLWDRFSSQMSGYNSFVQTNIDLFTSSLPSNFANLIISKGKMASTPSNFNTPASGSNSFSLTWSDDSGEGFKLSSDLIYFVAINETQESVVSGGGVVDRETCSVLIEFEDDFVEADVIHVYAAFKRADGTIVSNTNYSAKNVSA